MSIAVDISVPGVADNFSFKLACLENISDGYNGYRRYYHFKSSISNVVQLKITDD